MIRLKVAIELRHEIADLLIALCRAVSVPARFADAIRTHGELAMSP